MNQIPIIVISSSQTGTGKTTLALNLAAAFWCDGYEVGFLTSENATIRQFMQKRRALTQKHEIKLSFPYLLTQVTEFPSSKNQKKVIIADINVKDLAKYGSLFAIAHTLITVASSKDDLNWSHSDDYADAIWQAKKAAAARGAKINWIVVPNQLSATNTSLGDDLDLAAKRHGFRVAPMLHYRSAFKHLFDGYCAADMAVFPEVFPMTMADVYARQEILTLTDFLWK